MGTATLTTSSSARKERTSESGPYHVVHESFELAEADTLYGPNNCPPVPAGAEYLPDETTRDYARRMHYAAYQMSQATDARTRARWERHYLAFRDQIVLGNRKLIYRAVRRWQPTPTLADDMVGDCQIVLIQAVAAYNPWLGIRFSTYAFTCLMRALSRMSQRHANDRLAKSVPLEALPDGEPRNGEAEEPPTTRIARLDEFLDEHHDLLSDREKVVLMRRFSLDETTRSGTLEEVGKELGLSKERVRQVQASALGKLRKALSGLPIEG